MDGVLFQMEDNRTYFNVPDFRFNEFSIWDYTRMILYWVVFSIVFPGLCFALYKLHSKVRPDQVAPVYVTNLLISDLIQICLNPIQMTALYNFRHGDYWEHNYDIYIYGDQAYRCGVQVNVLFMMCVSAERYVMVAHAVWYRNIPNYMVSVIVSVAIWILSAMSWFIPIFTPIEKLPGYVMGAILLLPYPLVMFFFIATWHALSRSSVPRNDQIRIRSILGLILGIYTILFIPFILVMIDPYYFSGWYIYQIGYILVALNPLFDFLLYVLIRKDVTHMCSTLLFCCNKRQGADITQG